MISRFFILLAIVLIGVVLATLDWRLVALWGALWLWMLGYMMRSLAPTGEARKPYNLHPPVE